MAEPLTIVTAFIDAINNHDVDRIATMLSADHLFIDCLGNNVRGRQAMRTGWQSYFELFPDYRIEVSAILETNDTVAVFGAAAATLHLDGAPGGNWSIPAAWRARVVDGLIQEWQVYADNKPVYQILAEAGISF